MFDIFSTDALATLLLVVVIFNYKRIGTFFNLSKVRLRASNWAPVPRSEMPSHIAHLLSCAESALKALGFEFVSTLAVEPINALDPRARMFGALYWHPKSGVLAVAELAEPSSGQATKVNFMTEFSDGKLLLTVNRERFTQLPVPTGTLVEDVYADDLDGQWQAHLIAMEREVTTEHRVPVTERSEAIRRHAGFGPARWVSGMKEIGWVREPSPDQYYFTPRGAWRYAGQLARLPVLARRALVRPYRHDPVPDIKAMRLAEMESVAANIALAFHPFPAWLKATLFTSTLVLSAILFGRGFGLIDAAALLLVLLLHELGHLAAMWTFNYRNLSIFFLPMLGAAATGHKPHAPPWQEAIVLLAGPVPSLVLVLAVTQIPSEALPLPAIEFIRAFVWFGLTLNLFNLLPFGILDGGRLFELAVLGRFPYARAAFATLGAIVGLLYAAWAGSLIFGLAMIMLLSATRLQFRAARVIAIIRSKAKAAGLGLLGGEQAISALGWEFGHGDYGGRDARGWMQRLNIARLAYPRLLQGIPGLGVTTGALVAQGMALLAPLILMVWFMQQPESVPLMRVTAAEKQALEKQLAESPDVRRNKAVLEEFVARYEAKTGPEAKWAMLDEHEQEMNESLGYDESHAKWIERQRAGLLEQLPADNLIKLRHRLDLARPDAIETTEVILSIISQLTGEGARPAAELGEDQFVLLMDAYRRLAEQVLPVKAGNQAADLEALWMALESPSHPHAALRPEIASIRARMAFSAGRIDEAEIWMDHYMAAVGPAYAHAPLVRAWFLLDIGRAEQALTLANRAILTIKFPDYSLTQWQTVAGWAEMGRRHPREADIHFQAALSSHAALMKQSRDDLPWWLRLLSRTPNGAPTRINALTLDHLAALEDYDPQEATRLVAELGSGPSSLSEEHQRAALHLGRTFDGWGRVRETAHKKILGYWTPSKQVRPDS